MFYISYFIIFQDYTQNLCVIRKPFNVLIEEWSISLFIWYLNELISRIQKCVHLLANKQYQGVIYRMLF